MMRVATTLITAAAMLVHALLGCCGHHAHAAVHAPGATCDSADHASDCALDEHADCGHHRHSPAPASDGDHAPSKPCGGSKCQWLVAHGTSKLILQWQWSLDSVSFDSALAPEIVASEYGRVGAPSAGPPPVLLSAKLRAHARLSLWQV